MQRPSMILAAGGVAVCALAAWGGRAFFGGSFLFAVMLWLFVSLGALAQLMLHHLAGGRWSFFVQRLFEAALAPLPAMAVLWVVSLLSVPQYWEGRGYFHPGWVALRGAVCFAVWLWLASALRRGSLRQDATADPAPTRAMRALSGPGLVLYFLTVSFAALDWLMQLEPGWRSTMFPGIVMATQTLLILSGATAAAAWLLPRSPELAAAASPQAWHDLGKLLFAFVIFWAYVCFSQLLIIWAGNLPAEAVWYVRRGEEGWGWMGRALGALCFFAPAGVLLFQAPKRRPRTLGAVAAAIWATQAAFLFWVIIPFFSRAPRFAWTDAVLPIAVGAIWAAFCAPSWLSAPPVPKRNFRALSPEAQAV